MKKKWFMLKRLISDMMLLHRKEDVYQISENLQNESLEYPFLFDENIINSGKNQKLLSSFDENGIPLIRSYIDVKDNELHYYPITIGQVGISVYHSFLKSNSEDDKKRFLKFADYFVDHAEINGDIAYWKTEVPKPEYKIIKPWKSAFSQSRAISILLRAYFITENKDLLDLIDKALNQYEKAIHQNGVSVQTPKGLFFEEYAASEPTMVLDGHIFSMFGLIDLLKMKAKLPEALVKKTQVLFDKGLAGIRDSFPLFDMGFWLKFNLCRMSHYPKVDPCTNLYMKVIQEQLTVLYRFTNNDYYKNIADKVASYINFDNSFKALKIKYKSLKQLNRV